MREATLVVTGVPNPADMESMQAYLQGVMPLLQGAGGKLVKRLKVGETLNGAKTGMVLVMDFDSAKAVSELFASDDYQALLPARDKGFKEMNIHITQAM